MVLRGGIFCFCLFVLLCFSLRLCIIALHTIHDLSLEITTQPTFPEQKQNYQVHLLQFTEVISKS